MVISSDLYLEAAGSVILYFSCTLAAAAGIGGGGLSVLLVFFNFGFRKGVILSLWAIFGNILAQIFLTYNKHHPLDKCRTLVYWDMIFVSLPAKLFGSTIGVLISNSAPATVLAMLAIFVLLFVIYITVQKYQDLLCLEKAACDTFEAKDLPGERDSLLNVNRMLLAFSPSADARTSLLRTSTMDSETTIGTLNRDSSLASTCRVEVPWIIIMSLMGTWCGYILAFFILTEIKKCSTDYIIVTCIFYPLLFVTIFVRLRHLAGVQKANEDNNEVVVLEGDIMWKNVQWRMTIVTVAVGAMSSLLGIDSGELISPLFLYMGLLPRVAGATTCMLSLFVTSASILEYGIRLDFHYVLSFSAFWFFSIGVLGGLTGRKIIEQNKRSSNVILALILVLCIDVTLLIYYLAVRQPDFSIKSFCSTKN